MSEHPENPETSQGQMLAAGFSTRMAENGNLAGSATTTEIDHAKIVAATTALLESIGEDTGREGLLATPDRVARAWAELTSGYRVDPVKLINDAIFEVDHDDMVIVRDIAFHSLCEHHLLPFVGRAHVAYIPQGRIVGLSKIPRIVDMYARRLQVQERMTRQIADFLSSVLTPHGVAVVVEGMHFCSVMRGVKKHEASMTTSSMLGTFRENPAARSEFHVLLGRSGNGELIG
ncbi:MAG: GTP cyclohydrolase I FolE [Anaerolineaceae bacterium]|nr:GTP cyclohydrolase I FolE [Anaerolineaceae bacterium]MCY3906141.1 GTP cyclohydrolase I FolE [Anaerolineaceae bacterium]